MNAQNIYNATSLSFLRKVAAAANTASSAASTTTSGTTSSSTTLSGNTNVNTGTATVKAPTMVRQSLTGHPMSENAAKTRDTGFEIRQMSGMNNTAMMPGFMLGKTADYYTELQDRFERMYKDAVMWGPGGWMWDTDQGFEGNLSGYGGTIGSLLGAGAGAGLGGFGGSAAPGVGTIAGGVAGGVAGGAIGGIAGRGILGGVGKGIDWLTGRQKGEAEPSWAARTFDPWSIAGDAAFGSIPGVGKGIGWAARGVKGVGSSLLGRSGQTVSQAIKANALKTKDIAIQQAKQMGMKAYTPVAGASFASNMAGRAANFGKNMVRPFATRQGLTQVGKQLVPMAGLGFGANMLLDRNRGGASPAGGPVRRAAFQNTQGYTNVVGNANRGFSGVNYTPNNQAPVPSY